MQIEENVQQPEHLFTDEDIFQYEEASTGQRFLNYLIDALLMQYGLGLATGYLLAKILISLAPDLAYTLFIEEGTFSFLFLNYLLSMLNYLIYYTFCEKAFRGYTLGKLITGTRAIRQDGKELTFKDTLLRSLARMVPFEPFSIWGGNGIWHDRWTKTMVIKSR
jgi:uncharacterized RDD family membrane protein YckC